MRQIILYNIPTTVSVNIIIITILIFFNNSKNVNIKLFLRLLIYYAILNKYYVIKNLNVKHLLNFYFSLFCLKLKRIKYNDITIV